MPVHNSPDEFAQYILQKLQKPFKVKPNGQDLALKIDKIVKPKKEVKY